MTKAEVIEQVLETMELTEKRDRVLMIGDRFHDVEGAAKAGLSCLGVTYGYGSPRELLEAGAMGIIDYPGELETLLDSMEEQERWRPFGNEIFPGMKAVFQTPGHWKRIVFHSCVSRRPGSQRSSLFFR